MTLPKPNIVAAVLLSALLLSAFGAFRGPGLKNASPWEYDEGVYLASARLVAQGNPLFTSVFSSQPPLFVETLATAFRVFGDTVLVARAVVFASYLVGLLLAGLLAVEIAAPLAAPVAILVMGVWIVFFMQARIIGSEMPSIDFALLSLYLLLSLRRRPVAASVAAGISLGVGCLFKLLVLPMFAPALFFFLLFPDRRRALGGPRWARPVILFLIFALAAVLTWVLVSWPFGLRKVIDQSIVFQMVSRNRAGNSRLPDLLANTFGGETALLTLVLGGLTVLAWKKTRTALWLITWIAAGLIFGFFRRPFLARHLFVIFPALALAASANVLWLSLFKRRVWQALLGAAIFLLSIGCGHFEALAIAAIGDGYVGVSASDGLVSDQVRAVIRRDTAPSDLVVTDDQIEVFRAGRAIAPALVDTSLTRIGTRYLTGEQVIQASLNATMVIFWTGRLQKIKKFRAWVLDHFDLVYTLGTNPRELKEIYVRR